MRVVKVLVNAAIVAVFSFCAYSDNPKFIWTGGGTPDNEGFHLWSHAENWQDGKIPTMAAAGASNSGVYVFSNALANTKIKCDVDTSHHIGGLFFGENQGTISIVQGDASKSGLRTFSNGSISVPAGTTVDFGLNCEENNDSAKADVKISGGGTFNFCASGKFSANRWKLQVEGATTVLGLNCTGSDIKFDSVVIDLRNQTTRLSLGSDTRIAAVLGHSWGRGQILLNGHKLTLTGGNAGFAGNFEQYSVYTNAGIIEISGGNILTNVYKDSFKYFSGDFILKNADVKNVGVAFPETTDIRIESSGVLSLYSDQTVASLTGAGITGGIEIHDGCKFVASSGGGYSARITGAGDFEKSGSDTLVLSGANTLTGKTKVNAGKLKVNGSTAASAVESAPGYSFSFEGNLQDSVSGNSAVFSYCTNGKDDQSVPDGATASEYCVGRNGGRGVRLHKNAAASVYYNKTGAFNSSNGPFTATVWMKPDEDMRLYDSGINWGCNAIFYFGSGNNSELNSFKVYLSSGTNFNFSAGGYKAGKVSENYPDHGFDAAVSQDILYDGKWHMLTVTYSGSDTKTISGYFDGQKLGEKKLSSDLNLNGRLHLGWGGYGRLSGDFDDFKVLWRCQSASEIADEFSGTVREADAFAQLPRPVAHWAFDDEENAGMDSSGNAYHLSPDNDAKPIVSLPAIVNVPGASGKALAPSNMYYWAESKFPAKFPHGGNPWTISVRCALNSLVEGSSKLHPMVFMWGENDNSAYAQADENERKYLGVQFCNINYRANYMGLHYQGSKYSEPNKVFKDVSYQPVFTQANWVHIMVSYSNEDGIRSYIDGVEVDYYSNLRMNIDPVKILVGYRPNFFYEARNKPIDHDHGYFPGYIDDIAVWDRVLTAEQIRAYVRGLRTGSAGSPLSADSDLSIAENAVVEVSGTCVKAKSVTGDGTLKIEEHSSLTLGGGNLTGALSGLGQLTLTAPFKVADASEYYGKLILAGSGSIDAPTYTKEVSLPEGYAVTLPSVASLPLLRTGGAAVFPAEGSIYFTMSPSAEGVYLVAEAADLSVPDSFERWSIGEDGCAQGGYRMKLFLSDGKVYLRVRKIRGTSVILK